jgi:hypothetical protein
VNRAGLPPQAVLNRDLSAAVGQDVIKVEVVEVAAGDELQVSFKEQHSQWRQGIWLAVDGELEVAGIRADQIELWTDTAPATVDVRVAASGDGLLRLYNIWDSGRGRRRESQSATSGMLKEAATADRTVYRCNDIGRDPLFNKFVFELSAHRCHR